MGPGAYHEVNNNLGTHRPYVQRSSTASRVVSGPRGASLSRSKRELSDASLEFLQTAPGSYELGSIFAPRGSRKLLMMGSQHGTGAFLSSGRATLLTPDATNYIVTPKSGQMFNGQQLGPGSYNLPMCTRGETKREMNHRYKPPSAEHADTPGGHGSKNSDDLRAASRASTRRRPEVPQVQDDWVAEVRMVRSLPPSEDTQILQERRHLEIKLNRIHLQIQNYHASSARYREQGDKPMGWLVDLLRL